VMSHSRSPLLCSLHGRLVIGFGQRIGKRMLQPSANPAPPPNFLGGGGEEKSRMRVP
jgi:hypothetical protein